MKNDHRQHESGSFVKSVSYACSGIVGALRSEANLRIQFVAAGLVLILAWILNLSLGQVSILVITTTFVLVMEIMNTVVESLADVVHPNQHKEIRKLKDMMAGAVMLSSLSAVIVGVLIFAPPIVLLFV
jgi:diacylglycerol kinase